MYRILVAILVVTAVASAARRWRQGQLNTVRFLGWTTAWIGAAILSFAPNLSFYVTNLAGIQRGADLFFFLAIMLLGYVLFYMHLRLEAQQRELTELVRQLALKDLQRDATKGGETKSEPHG